MAQVLWLIALSVFVKDVAGSYGPNRVKPGQCPTLSPGTVGICLQQCSGDFSCPGKQKCCSNGCGNVCTHAVKPGNCPVLPPGTVGTCDERCTGDFSCPGKQKCCSHGCGHSCQAPAKKIKPGTCPKLPPGTVGICVELCSGDDSCPGDQKCCSNGCGHACQSPEKKKHRKYPCKFGKPFRINGKEAICGGGSNSIRCPAAYFCKSRKCCPNARVKPGQCPTLPPGTVGTCDERCTGDFSCPGKQKCCSHGCGHSCQAPAKKIKPGTCPKLPPGTVGICVERCSGDDSCPGDQKCCSNGCGHTCQSPDHINPCKIGKPLGQIFCGRGPNRRDCPSGWECEIDPADRFAVCCQTRKRTYG